ncbi:glycosyltransferase [Candidatus Gottesmanbacteria bacterium]|nr:glycosyltransferase [Candidatus Gottesmanbacteria bacterium]
MKIALLAPPYLSVPPKAYGGTEKIVSLLADGLVENGFDVTLFATGDSQTKAKLISVFPKSLGNSGLAKGSALMPLLHFRECFKRAGEFDIIHNHAQYIPMFLADFVNTPVVCFWLILLIPPLSIQCMVHFMKERCQKKKDRFCKLSKITDLSVSPIIKEGDCRS